jgi:hypothetical protein
MEVKVGDVVHVRAKVIRLGTPSHRVAELLDGSFDAFGFLHIDCDDIVHVEQRPLQVGDRVRDPDRSFVKGEVVAIKGDDVCVDYGGEYGLVVEELDRLERI